MHEKRPLKTILYCTLLLFLLVKTKRKFALKMFRLNCKIPKKKLVIESFFKKKFLI